MDDTSHTKIRNFSDRIENAYLGAIQPVGALSVGDTFIWHEQVWIYVDLTPTLVTDKTGDYVQHAVTMQSSYGDERQVNLFEQVIPCIYEFFRRIEEEVETDKQPNWPSINLQEIDE